MGGDSDDEVSMVTGMVLAAIFFVSSGDLEITFASLVD
jgi:hypothetical protein